MPRADQIGQPLAHVSDRVAQLPDRCVRNVSRLHLAFVPVQDELPRGEFEIGDGLECELVLR